MPCMMMPSLLTAIVLLPRAAARCPLVEVLTGGVYPYRDPLSLERPRCQIAPAIMEGRRADDVRKESISRAAQAGGRGHRVRQSRHHRAAADGCVRDRERDPLSA